MYMAWRAPATVILIILTILVIFSGCIKDSYIKYGDIQYREIPGVDPNLISLDIYVPNIPLKDELKDPFPVMIWVHGGGWIAGDKANRLEHKIRLFINAGWIFVSVNYRLSPSDIPSNPDDMDPNRIKYPVHCQDVASAIAWVYHNIADYGGDPSQISLMGHSAGAYIVSAIATNESFLKEYGLNLSIIKHAVSLDTEGYDIDTVIKYAPSSLSLLYINAFGNNPGVWYDASPINHIESGKSIPPFFVVTRGSKLRINISERFVNKLKSAGVYAEIICALNYSHSEVNDAIGNPYDDVITPALKEFLGISDKCFPSCDFQTIKGIKSS